MLSIALSTVRSRRGAIAGALVGVTVAISLVISSAMILESTLRADVPLERITRADVIVHHEQVIRLGQDEEALVERARVDGGIVATIRGLDGVAAAIGDRSIPVEILDVAGAAAVDPVEVTGHGWEGIALTDATLKVGRQPHRPDEIVVDGLRVDGRVPRPGDRLTIATAHTTSAFRVVGITNESSRDAAVYFTTAEARRLAGTGAAVDLIGVVAAHGVDVPKLARRIDSIARSRGLHVTTGTRRGDVESYVDALNRDGVVSGLSVLGVLGLFVALFVISGAFALSVQQRHRELALLRAIGATPRQVKRMIALESLVVALVGALAAWGLGVLVASAERELCVRAGVLPESFELTIGWLPPVIGAVVAVVTTRLAVFASARRASRIRPVDALRESTAEARPLTRVRLIAGLAVVVLGTIVFLSTTRNLSESGGDDAPAAGIVWMLAAVLLGPVLALPFVWAVGGLLERLSPASGLLAKANARANLRRLTSVATPLMLAVSLGCALLASRGTVEHHTATQSRQSVLADRILVSHGSGLPPDAITAARRVPGVRGVVSTFPTTMVVDSAGHPVTVDTRVANGVSLPMAVDLDVRDGSLSALHGNTFAADAQQAGALGWEVGDRIRLWRGDGTPVALELVAIYRRPLGFAHIVVPPPVVDAHVTNAFAKTAFVTFLPTADPAAVDRALERAAGPSNEVEVMSSDEYHASVAAQVRRDSFAAFAILGIVVVFAGIAAVNSLAVAVTERSHDIELMRLIGATRRQLVSSIRLEVVIVVVFATIVGMATAAPGAMAFAYGQTGSYVPTIPPSIWLGIPVMAALLTFVAITFPVRAALRRGRGSVTASQE